MKPQPTQESLQDQVERLQREVATLRNELAVSERRATLGTMAGAIAHEFNNILTPVRTYAEMALGAPEDADLSQKALLKASHGASKAAKIARSLLGFACGDDGQPVANVRAAVEEALTCMARDPAKDGINLTIDVDEDLVVAMSEAALEQVLINLALNAVEAMRGKRGARLEITAERSTWNSSREDHPGAICVRVRDTGGGIPEQVRTQLFQPFASGRGSSSRRRSNEAREGGAGLGLAICRRLIESAGGRIDVETAPGAGTTFSFVLPEATLPDPTPTSVEAGAAA